MTTAIVVLNANDSELSLSYLKRIIGYHVFDHIILTDNRSNDAYAAELKRYCDSQDKLDFILTDGNRGYSAGNNRGAKYAIKKYGADLIFISNPDVICEEDSIKKIIDVFDQDHDVGVATGLIYNFDVKHRAKVFSGFAYKVPTYKDMLVNCFPIFGRIRTIISRNAMFYNIDKIKYGELMYVGCVSGCFFAISSEALKRMGYFDEDVFLYCEESMIGHKMRDRGYKVCVVTDAPIYHDEDPLKLSTIRKYITRRRRERKSATIYVKKYLHSSKIATVFYEAAYHIGGAEMFVIKYLRPKVRRILADQSGKQAKP